MFDTDDTAGEAAASYTDEFVDAAIAKLDSVFGKGYAEKNPAALAGYVTACATNLNAFMVASTSMASDGILNAMSALDAMEEDDLSFLPTPKPKKRGKK